jgi:hypothetical protein
MNVADASQVTERVDPRGAEGKSSSLGEGLGVLTALACNDHGLAIAGRPRPTQDRSGENDIVLVGFDGSRFWTDRWSAGRDSLVQSLAMDPSGAAYAAGEFYEKLELGNTKLAGAGTRAFVAKLVP